MINTETSDWLQQIGEHKTHLILLGKENVTDAEAEQSLIESLEAERLEEAIRVELFWREFKKRGMRNL